MATELEKIQEQMDFYQSVLPLEKALEETRANKKEDPQAFFDAKQAFEEQRTYWRQIGEYLKSNADVVEPDPAVTDISVSPVTVDSTPVDSTPTVEV